MRRRNRSRCKLCFELYMKENGSDDWYCDDCWKDYERGYVQSFRDDRAMFNTTNPPLTPPHSLHTATNSEGRVK